MYTIASNAGVEGAVVVGKLLEQDNPDLGYDAAKGICSCMPLPISTHHRTKTCHPRAKNTFHMQQVNM